MKLIKVNNMYCYVIEKSKYAVYFYYLNIFQIIKEFIKGIKYIDKWTILDV